MTLPELLNLMQNDSFDKCKSIFETHCSIRNIHDSLKQYNPKLHDVNDKFKRPDKTIEGKPPVKVNRVPLAIQKKIVLTAAAFLGTPEVQCNAKKGKEQTMLNGVNRTWETNKLDYTFRKIAKRTMSERHCAELWSVIQIDSTTDRPLPNEMADKTYWDGTGVTGKFKLSMQILSHCYGNTLYPLFDDFGDMIAFANGYSKKTIDAKEVNHLDIYTADQIYYSKNEEGVWLFADLNMTYTEGFKSIKNIIGKIPVVYYSQPITEWEDVQPLIDRLETLLSNHADTNDYSGSPIVLAEGDVTGFSEKDDQGKVLKLENGAKVSYLTFDAAPESIKMEIENLRKDIFDLTHTPDISFSNMKGIGALSGVALQTFFLDAHLKASDREETFGEGLQRRINYIKKALTVIDSSLLHVYSLQIKPKFTYFLPKNRQEDLDNIIKAVTGGIMSTETGVILNPLIEDGEAEWLKVQGKAGPGK